MPPSGHDEFEKSALPHLHQAFNLARWLTRSQQDAEDLVQEAYLRAFRFYRHFRGGDMRPWLLQIVRNTCYTWLRQNAREEWADGDVESLGSDQRFNPEALAIQQNSFQLLRDALESLPPRLREVLVLREMEGMSYEEISNIVQVPIGTVMSSLSRARARLRVLYLEAERQEA